MTGSFIFGIILRIGQVLTLWYENSLIHRFAALMAIYIENSLILGRPYRLIKHGSQTDYAGGSRLIGLINGTSSWVWRGMQKLYTTTAEPVIDGSLMLRVLNWDGWVMKIFRPEVFLSVFIVFMSVIPAQYWRNSYITAAVMVAALLYGRRLLLSGGRETHKGIPVSLLLFLGISILSLSQSAAFSDSLRVLVIFLSCASFAILIHHIADTPERREMVLCAVFVGVFLTAMYGLYQYAMGMKVRSDWVDLASNPGLRRVFSTMYNPNDYAEYLILFLPVCVSYALNRTTELGRFAACAMLLPIFLALVLTSSRAAYLVVVGAFALYTLLANKRLVPLVIIAGVLAIPFVPASIVKRLLTIGTDTSSHFRMMIWNAAIRVLKDFWVCGIGIGPEAFKKVYPIYANPDAMRAMHSHNLFLQIWLENGLFGMVAFMTFFLGTIRKLLTGVLNDASFFGIKSYRIALICGLAGIAMFGMVENVWFYPRVMLSFWIVAGLSSAMSS